MVSALFALLALGASVAVVTADRNACPVNSKVTACKLVKDQTGEYYNCYGSYCYGPDCMEKELYESLCRSGLKYDHFSCYKQNCHNNTEMKSVECECTACQPSIYDLCNVTATQETMAVTVAKKEESGICHTAAEPKYCATRYGNASYCGVSSQPAARVPDDSGCSCNWNCAYGPKAPDAPWLGAECKCPDTPPTPPAPGPSPAPPACVGQCCHEKSDFCLVKDSAAYCGKSDQEFARFPDGSGCSCRWNYEYKDDICTPKQPDQAVFV